VITVTYSDLQTAIPQSCGSKHSPRRASLDWRPFWSDQPFSAETSDRLTFNSLFAVCRKLVAPPQEMGQEAPPWVSHRCGAFR